MYEETLREFLDEYEWIHLTIGLFGNVLFFVGSILFLLDLQPVGIRVFIVGSFLMLIGSLGNAVVTYVRNGA